MGWKVIPRIGVSGFGVSPHGLAIMLGYLLGAILLARRARKEGFDEEHAWNAAAWGVVGAILGARIAYLAGHFGDFAGPLEWLKIWEGGISFVGGLIGGFLAAYLYCRRHKLDFVMLADLAVPGVALGTIIARIGDLMIGDHLGKPTDGWWGWTYKGGRLISMPPCLTAGNDPIYPSPDGCILPGMKVHQTALYDQLWAIVIVAVLLYLGRTVHKRGFLAFVWVTMYGLGRIATDFLRVDKTWLGLGLTGSQLTSIAAVAISVYLLIRYRGARPLPEARLTDPGN